VFEKPRRQRRGGFFNTAVKDGGVRKTPYGVFFNLAT